MSTSASRSSVWAEMSEAQRVESVREGRASLKEIVAGLLDGPDNLREACRTSLVQTDVSFEKLQIQTETDHPLANQQEFTPDEESERVTEEVIPNYPVGELIDSVRKRRPGLPKGYVPRPYRH